MSKIDLHIHTNVSDDGEYAPAEIIRMCKAKGIEIISITDHNSVRGAKEALSAADGLNIISGVELDSTYYGRNFHLLGYGFDITREEFIEIEQDVLTQEKASAKLKINLFQNATGLPVREEDILETAKDGVVTGEMIAEHVLAWKDASKHEILHPYLPGGEKSDMPNVRIYWDFFSEGKPAYVPIRYISIPDAIRLIHNAGGAAVLAHPGQNLSDHDRILLTDMIAEGIDGLEVYSSYHSKLTAAFYLNIAKKHQLMVTCGSDFHGKHKPNIHLGGHRADLSDEYLIAQMNACINPTK